MENQKSLNLLTKQEAADYIGVSVATLSNIMREPGFPIVRIGARRVFINREKLDKWIDEKTEK